MSKFAFRRLILIDNYMLMFPFLCNCICLLAMLDLHCCTSFAVVAAAAAAAKSLQSCPTLCNPIDGSPPGFPVPGFLQARTLEWGAIAFSLVAARRDYSLVAAHRLLVAVASLAEHSL